MTLEDAIGIGKRAQKEPDRVVSEFRDRYHAEDDVRDLVDLALQLEDLTRNAGKHAGGVVIAPSPLSDFSRCSPNTTARATAATRSPSSTRTTSRRWGW